MSDESSPRPAPAAPRVPFMVAALITLCFAAKGGWFGFIGGATLSLPFAAWGAAGAGLYGGEFMVLWLLTWCGCLALLLLYPRNFSRRMSVAVLLTLAFAARVLLLPHIVSDDVNRYLWEGRVLTAGLSPYAHAPDDPELAPLAANDPWHAGVNHPDYTSAYPPLVLRLFQALAAAREISPALYSPLTIKWVMIFFDMGTIALLLAILQQRRRDLRWVILYAFNPVILYSFAGQAHFDVMQNFFVMATVYAYGTRRWGWMFLAAGLAVQTKYIPLILLPFLIRRDNWRWLGVTLAVIVIPYVPFLTTDGLAVFAGIRRFSSELAINGGLHHFLRLGLEGSIPAATLVCRILLGISLLWGYWHFHPQRSARFRGDPVSGIFFALGAFLLLAPTFHFWYLSWLLPLIVLRPTASWMLLSLTIGGYFIANGLQHHGFGWTIPLWMVGCEWLPFYLCFGRDVYLFLCRRKYALPQTPPQDVTVVIPTRNEADGIGVCVAALLTDAAVREVIVVDGGSSDATVARAQAAKARVLRHDRPLSAGGGRGGQIHAGVMVAAGDVVAIVHADTRVMPETFTRILHLLEREPTVVGGAVGAIFTAANWRLRVLEYMNDFRLACLGISFGDQVQFFRRAPVVAHDLFPNIPLMEDVEFSLRLHCLGRQDLLYGNAEVSARRWQASGYGRSLTVIRLVAAYLWTRLWRTPDTLAMYRRYYD